MYQVMFFWKLSYKRVLCWKETHDVILEAVMGEDVLLKQSERACDVLLEWTLEQMCGVWKECK